MPSAAVRRLSPLQWAGVGLGGCAVLLALLGLLAPASTFFFPLLSLWASVGLFVLALCVLRVAGAELDFFHKAVVFGIWAVAVVYFYWTLSSRSFVYVWDYANYLLKQYDAEAAFAQSAGAGLAYIFGSMADDYTNFITLFTEFPFCLTSHTGDAYSFSQVFCILPTLLVLLAGLVVKVGQILNVKNRMYYFLFGMTLTAAYPFLRMSAVLAQPDWFGLIFGFAILLLTLDLRFDKLEPVRFGLIFLATAAIILARRWFLYFVVGYYFAYALLLIAGCVRLAKGGEKTPSLFESKTSSSSALPPSWRWSSCSGPWCPTSSPTTTQAATPIITAAVWPSRRSITSAGWACSTFSSWCWVSPLRRSTERPPCPVSPGVSWW